MDNPFYKVFPIFVTIVCRYTGKAIDGSNLSKILSGIYGIFHAILY